MFVGVYVVLCCVCVCVRVRVCVHVRTCMYICMYIQYVLKNLSLPFNERNGTSHYVPI